MQMCGGARTKEVGKRLTIAVVEIHEGKLGRDNETVAKTLRQVARCARTDGRKIVVERFIRRALGILETIHGPNTNMVRAARLLGTCLREAGRNDEVARLFRRSVQIFQAENRTDHYTAFFTREQRALCG